MTEVGSQSDAGSEFVAIAKRLAGNLPVLAKMRGGVAGEDEIFAADGWAWIRGGD